MLSKSLYFVILLIASQTVRADIPVHCLKHQVAGNWKFELGTPQVFSPEKKEHLCGHELPDNADTSDHMIPINLWKTQLYSLRNDNIAVDNSNSNSGTWTMVYDEGFAVDVGDFSYFAFSKFYKDGHDHKSDCSKTLIGWYHNKQENTMGCYKGYKIDGSSQINDEVKHEYVVQPKEYQSDVSESVETVTKQPETTTFVKKTETKPAATKDFLGNTDKEADHTFSILNKNSDDYYLNFDKDFTDHHKTAERLNNAGNSWTAKHHDIHKGFSLAQLNQKAGHRSRFQSKGKTQSKSRRSSYPLDFEIDDVSDLPKAFTWKKYLGKNREQKDCGSCYIFATMAMLEARLRIKDNEDVRLSVQHPLDCDVYNQGCDGGYPYLVEKFASEYELVPESCNSYRGMTTGQCSRCDVDSLEKTYKVSSFNFVGGAYGKSSERNMMIELKNNGPVVASFEPAYDFMFYNGGVYHGAKMEEWVFDGETRPEWEKVDHSVLLYGWGEENGEKYWELQNTWGDNWGENGHFRMRRGVDESAIESLAEAAIPEIIHKNASTRHSSSSYLEVEVPGKKHVSHFDDFHTSHTADYSMIRENTKFK